MSRQLTWSLVADGTTDRMLVPIIEWALRRQDPIVELLEPQFRKRHASIRDDLPDSDTGSMLVFVHRDAEKVPLDDRLREFAGIERDDLVPVVPVRMSEAWLLFDASAIAKAASSMAAALRTPGVGDLEGIADPKALLEDLLLDAAGRPTGRHGKVFRRSLVERRVSVAGFISDYSPLEQLPAFARFQQTLSEGYPYPVT